MDKNKIQKQIQLPESFEYEERIQREEMANMSFEERILATRRISLNYPFPWPEPEPSLYMIKKKSVWKRIKDFFKKKLF